MAHGLKYSRFIHMLKGKNIELDRKILATLAVESPESFNRVVTEASK
jgi:large subunit ribosomal protein L20